MILKDIGKSSPRIGPENFKRKSKIKTLAAANDVADYLENEDAKSHEGVEILDCGGWLVSGKNEFLDKLEVQVRRFQSLNDHYLQKVRNLCLCEHFVCSFPHDTDLSECERNAFDRYVIKNSFSRFPILKAWHRDKESKENKRRKVHVHYLVMNFDLELVPGYLDKAIRLRDSRSDFIGSICLTVRRAVDALNKQRDLDKEKIEGAKEARARRWENRNKTLTEAGKAELIRFEEAYCNALPSFLPRNEARGREMIEQAIEKTGWNTLSPQDGSKDEFIYLIPPIKTGSRNRKENESKPKKYRYSWIWFRATARTRFLELAKEPLDSGRDFDRLTLGIARQLEKGRKKVDTRMICSAIGKLGWRYRIRNEVVEFSTNSGDCCRQSVENLKEELAKRLDEISRFDANAHWYQDLAIRLRKSLGPKRRVKRKLIEEELHGLDCRVEFVGNSIVVWDPELRVCKVNLEDFEKALVDAYFNSVPYAKADALANWLSVSNGGEDGLCKVLLESDSLKVHQYKVRLEKAGYECWPAQRSLLLRSRNGEDVRIQTGELRKGLIAKMFGGYKITNESLEAREEKWLGKALSELSIKELKNEGVFVETTLKLLKANDCKAGSEQGAVYLLDPKGRPKMISAESLKPIFELGIELKRKGQRERISRFLEERIEKVDFEQKAFVLLSLKRKKEDWRNATAWLCKLLQLKIDRFSDEYFVSDNGSFSDASEYGGFFDVTLFDECCKEKLESYSVDKYAEIDLELERRLRKVAEGVNEEGYRALAKIAQSEGLSVRNANVWDSLVFCLEVDPEKSCTPIPIRERKFGNLKEFLNRFGPTLEPEPKRQDHSQVDGTHKKGRDEYGE